MDCNKIIYRNLEQYQSRDLLWNLLGSCSCVYFMTVIMVGNSNAQEAVLAISVLMSAEEHPSLLSIR